MTHVFPIEPQPPSRNKTVSDVPAPSARLTIRQDRCFSKAEAQHYKRPGSL